MTDFPWFNIPDQIVQGLPVGTRVRFNVGTVPDGWTIIVDPPDEAVIEGTVIAERTS